MPSPDQKPATTEWIIGPDEPILITGANGFIGRRVVESLLGLGFRNLRCFARSSSDSAKLTGLARQHEGARIEVLHGNLLSPTDCIAATRDIAVIYHLATGRGDMVADAFMNSVVTTRNLLEATLSHHCLKRLVNISSFTVYTNSDKARAGVLDETCPVEAKPESRGDAYTFAKAKQDEIVEEYGKKHGLPYVMVRPGAVYGEDSGSITNRVGIGTFGIFLHMGGSNLIPFTYVENCAEAIVLAGLKPGVEGEVFNVVDDDAPSSRRFLRLYKAKVRSFKSIYVPHFASYLLCALWERYCNWSEGQLPPVFNRKYWHAFWKPTCYSNQKLKNRLGWKQKVPTGEALQRYFESCSKRQSHA